MAKKDTAMKNNNVEAAKSVMNNAAMPATTQMPSAPKMADNPAAAATSKKK